jgi:hypothetical protein
MFLKKSGLLLAVIMGVGMFLVAPSQAAPPPEPAPGELWFLEVQFSGKGYAADTDNDTSTDPVYIEDKHALDAQTIYLMYERDDRRLSFAYYNEDIQGWETSNINNSVYETEYSVLCSTPNNMTIHTDSLGNEVHAAGIIRIQYKKKEGEPAKAKLKALGMSYTYVDEKEVEGQTVRAGVLKMKGKTIPQSEVPADVRTVFGLVP